MASEQPVGAGAPRPLPRASRGAPAVDSRPFWLDPLRLLGWGVALVALATYWWLFGRTAAPPPGSPNARLTGVVGSVRVRPHAQEAWLDGRLSMRLHVGDTVRTEPESAAAISFDSGSTVRVRPDSIVFVGGSAESSTTAWRISTGRVNFAVGAGGAEIETPSARTLARAHASGQLDVTPTGTGVKIFQGAAELRTVLGESVSLSGNQAVQVDPAGRAGARQDLPPAPSLLAPATRADLPYAAPPAPVATLRWTGTPGAATYHVALDFNVTQADLLLSAALDVPGVRDTAHELAGMDPGRYFWRVAGVTADGLEGQFSRVSLFSVLPRSPSPPPPPAAEAPALLVDALETVAPGVVRVAGRTVPGASLTVNGVGIAVSADGSFGEYLRMPAAGTVFVRATTRDGRSSERALRAGER